VSVDGRELVRGFLESSPFGRLVGLELESLGDGRAELVLRFREDVATAGTLVHGGAIGTLIDVAATASAWATDFDDMPSRWGTASLTVNYLRPADGKDLHASSVVTRRGRTLCFCQVEVSDGEALVATGLVVYTLATG
jgi:uncharacterized protein (TIGR00369 family)